MREDKKNMKDFYSVVIFLLFIGFSSHAWSADEMYGKELFGQHCVACHAINETVADKSGPNLFGIVGRTAGTAEYGFGFSDAMTTSEIVWDVDSLDQFLKSPAKFVGGTKMVFAGFFDAEDRSDLIAYLEQLKSDKKPSNEDTADSPVSTDCDE